MTQRIVGHYIGDMEHYRRPGELDAAKADEPLVRIRRRLAEAGVGVEPIATVEESVRAVVDAAAEAALRAPKADTSRVLEHLYA
jgi:pyruvate dehydrogenase E1 component alpha subunit